MSTVAEIKADIKEAIESGRGSCLVSIKTLSAILDHTDALEAENAKLNSRDSHNSEQLWRVAQLMGKGLSDIYSTRDVVDFSVAVIEDHAKLRDALESMRAVAMSPPVEKTWLKRIDAALSTSEQAPVYTDETRPEGFFWLQWGTSSDWRVMLWRGGVFWDDQDCGYGSENYVIGPQAFPPDSEQGEW